MTLSVFARILLAMVDRIWLVSAGKGEYRTFHRDRGRYYAAGIGDKVRNDCGPGLQQALLCRW